MPLLSLPTPHAANQTSHKWVRSSLWVAPYIDLYSADEDASTGAELDTHFILVENFASGFDPQIALFRADGTGVGHGDRTVPGRVFYAALGFTNNHPEMDFGAWAFDNPPCHLGCADAKTFSIKFTNVENLTQIAVPVPTALPLFVSGLGVMGWFARRKKRTRDARPMPPLVRGPLARPQMPVRR